MLTLREHQRAMRDLIRRDLVAEDPYVVAAAKCVGLEVTRDTIRNWHRFRLDRNCRLTSAILRQRGMYAHAFAVVEKHAGSPFIEQLANDFFDAAIALGDPLITSVASLERALNGSDETIVEWPCDPYPVLAALLQGEEIPGIPPETHTTIVADGSFRLA